MAKIHLVETTNPLTDGWRAVTMCGLDIASAAVGAMCDAAEFDDVDSLLRSRGICGECQKHEWRERYLYFVRETA